MPRKTDVLEVCSNIIREFNYSKAMLVPPSTSRFFSSLLPKVLEQHILPIYCLIIEMCNGFNSISSETGRFCISFMQGRHRFLQKSQREGTAYSGFYNKHYNRHRKDINYIHRTVFSCIPNSSLDRNE